MHSRATIILPFFVGFLLLAGVLNTLAEEVQVSAPPLDPVLPGAGLAKQIGGFAAALAVQGDYAYVGFGSRLDVFNVQNPGSPFPVGQTGMLTASFRSLQLIGSHGLASANHALYTFDLSNPLLPSLAHELSLPSQYVRDVQITGTMAFIAEERNYGSMGGSGGLRILDVTDPANPAQLGLFGDGHSVRAVSLYGNYAYLEYCESISSTGCIDRFVVVDVSNPLSPTQVSSVSSQVARGSAIYDHYLYRKIFNDYLEIYDLSNPGAPNYVTSISGTGSWDDVKVFADKIYLFDPVSVRVYDLVNPTNPQFFGSYFTGGFGAFDLQVISDTLYVAYGTSGLRTVDVSAAQPTLPEIGKYDRFSSPVAAEEVGGYVYLLNLYDSQLQILDVTVPTSPTTVAQYQQSGNRFQMELLGDDLFLLGYSALEIVDVTDPLTPSQRATYGTLNRPDHLQIEGNYAYIGIGDYQVDSLEIVDISNRDQPVFVASTGSPCRSGDDLHVEGSYVFLSEDSACSSLSSLLTVVDVTNPSQPQIVASQPVSYGAGSIAYLNGYIYMGNHGVRIIDVTNPLAPVYAGRYTVTNSIDFYYNVRAVNGFLFVTTEDSMGRPIRVILDVTNPVAPQAVGTFLHDDSLPVVAGSDLYRYVPDGDNGLLIYFDTVAPPQIDAGSNQSAVEGELVTFNATISGTGVLAGGIRWNFGDGQTAVGTLQPTHVYGDDGPYTVTVTATNIVGDFDTDSLVVTVTNAAPIVSAGLDLTATVSVPVGFTGTFTDPGYLDTHTITWDFGDGSSITGTLTPMHTYAMTGTYSVTLTVVDDEGAADDDTLQANVISRPTPPAVDAGSDQSAHEGASVAFAGTAVGSGVTAADVVWNFGDGNVVTGTLTPTHIFVDEGSYTVTLIVTDSYGLPGSDTLLVSVSNVAPTVIAGGDTMAGPGQSIQFSGSFTDPGILDLHTITWDFGDGQTASGSLTATHAYTRAGTYTVMLIVADEDGGVGTDSLIVQVQDFKLFLPAVVRNP